MIAQCNGKESRQLVLATAALVACFAIFGSVAGMMPAIQERLRLNDVQVGLVLAMPVLIGSIGRIPVGMLADRSSCAVRSSTTSWNENRYAWRGPRFGLTKPSSTRRTMALRERLSIS